MIVIVLCVPQRAVSQRGTSHLHSLRKGVIEGGVQNSCDEQTLDSWCVCSAQGGSGCGVGLCVSEVTPLSEMSALSEPKHSSKNLKRLSSSTPRMQNNTTRHNTTSHRTSTTVSLLPLSLPGTWMRVGAATL